MKQLETPGGLEEYADRRMFPLTEADVVPRRGDGAHPRSAPRRRVGLWGAAPPTTTSPLANTLALDFVTSHGLKDHSVVQRSEGYSPDIKRTNATAHPQHTRCTCGSLVRPQRGSGSVASPEWPTVAADLRGLALTRACLPAAPSSAVTHDGGAGPSRRCVRAEISLLGR